MGLDMYLEAKLHLPPYSKELAPVRQAIGNAIGYTPPTEKPDNDATLMEITGVIVRADYSLFDRTTGRPVCVGNGETFRRTSKDGIRNACGCVVGIFLRLYRGSIRRQTHQSLAHPPVFD